MSTVLLLNAWMESPNEYILISSHTLPTIPRSKCFPFQCRFTSYLPRTQIRVLLATIWSLGLCLCPQYNVKKSQVDQMGTIRDDNRQGKGVQDSITRQYEVWAEIVYDNIYKHGKGVKSKAVEDMLANQSLVPTRVSPHSIQPQERVSKRFIDCHRMPLLINWVHSGSISSWYSL